MSAWLLHSERAIVAFMEESVAMEIEVVATGFRYKSFVSVVSGPGTLVCGDATNEVSSGHSSHHVHLHAV